MNFRDKEKSRATDIIENVIRAKGNGLYGNKHYPFMLQDGQFNLWDGIREDALHYFNKYNIAWWRSGEEKLPTGHILSSQVACVNHLYWLRSRKNAALAIIKGIIPDVVDVGIIDEGYIGFEVIGAKNYLGEKSHSRGANATAVDAAMIAKTTEQNILIFIEWKYTEIYGGKTKYKPARADIYDRIIDEKGSPIRIENKEAVYFEPYYQLMRQMLLAWKMVQAGDYDCDDFIHLHVIPSGNVELLKTNRSPYLPGNNLTDAWKSALRNPEKYKIIDPKELLDPIKNIQDTKSILRYLAGRYWEQIST